MRVFLCAYTGFSVAIPMSSVCALTLYDDAPQETVERKQENGNTYISLPLLFGLPEELIRHGIVLKNGNDEDHNIDENRTVLLTAEVKCETEIPDEKIYPLPKIFAFLRFSAIFSGIQFDSCPVLLINPEYLVQNLYKELAV
jgi:hypothetical protein